MTDAEPDAGPDNRRAVAIGRLTLTDFRNYSALSLDLAPGAVVLTGDNGAGKTNLLEAVSFLSPGRGLRRAAYGDVTRAGAARGFAVAAEIGDGGAPVAIGTGVRLGDNGDSPDEFSRRVRINGANARSADELLDIVRVAWLTPAFDGLFTGSAAERRRFLDRLVLAIDPGHGRRALDFDKAMRGRNRLLGEGSRDRAFFEAIELEMAATGVAVAAARAETVRLLAGMAERVPGDGAFPQASVSLDGMLEARYGETAAVDLEEDYRRRLGAERERDRAAGRALEGPHRTDLLVRHADKDMPAALCSTGEQKALLIGLVLAHARLTAEMSGMTPILLLDEIAAHLDARRRAALFAILDGLGGQFFMTGTDASLFTALGGKAQFIQVREGQVVET